MDSCRSSQHYIMPFGSVVSMPVWTLIVLKMLRLETWQEYDH